MVLMIVFHLFLLVLFLAVITDGLMKYCSRKAKFGIIHEKLCSASNTIQQTNPVDHEANRTSKIMDSLTSKNSISNNVGKEISYAETHRAPPHHLKLPPPFNNILDVDANSRELIYEVQLSSRQIGFEIVEERDDSQSKRFARVGEVMTFYIHDVV